MLCWVWRRPGRDWIFENRGKNIFGDSMRDGTMLSNLILLEQSDEAVMVSGKKLATPILVSLLYKKVKG